jgi:hypothetical protein
MAATPISCSAFVLLAVKWPLHTWRISKITVKALVTSNIIQSVCLEGKGRYIFSFKKSAKTGAD